MKSTTEDFKPYISAEENPRELTIVSVVCGILLAVVFGAANAYLGLRVGMTVSASIPAAVVSMIIMRVFLHRRSILENNMVQTIASAGESVAAGVIFTIPAFFLWEKEGCVPAQPFSTITLLTLFGGLLGVLFMIPLRHYLIVQEDQKLIFPEGRACAEVLLSAEKKSMAGKYIFWGAGLGALVKFLVDGVRIVSSSIYFQVSALRTAVSAEPYPALLGVGYICGLKVSAMVFAGSLLSWLVLIPMIVFFGGENVVDHTQSIASIYAAKGANGIWSCYIRYIGAGAVAALAYAGDDPEIGAELLRVLKAADGADGGNCGEGRYDPDAADSHQGEHRL